MPAVYSIGSTNVYMNQFPFDLDKEYELETHSRLSSYDVVVLNSLYSQGWYDRCTSSMLQVMARKGMIIPHRLVVYPPVTLFDIPDLEADREPVILLTGRFFDDVQGKKHLEAIGAFERLRGLVEASGRGGHTPTLYLVGRQMPEARHAAYTDKVVQVAGQVGNVEVRINFGGAELAALMPRVSVVWSFTGGVGENNNPADSEHFGIAIVEAMSAGNIPVLLNRGGLREIVDRDENYLCSTLDEIAEKTFPLHVRYYKGGPGEAAPARRAHSAEKFKAQKFYHRIPFKCQGPHNPETRCGPRTRFLC
eukprot:FR740684.1.p1 GENE.FR740684.1~~FR740684.1.p1  ORF type:complete len:320 (+),score=50.65 FR740684.1:42-962(+)